MPIRITDVTARDIRFPTSRQHIGSDAMNPACDYSAAYCVLNTDSEFQGHGMVASLQPMRFPRVIANLYFVLSTTRLSQLVVGTILFAEPSKPSPVELKARPSIP